MFSQRVMPEDILDRLNAEAYSPSHIENARVMRATGAPLVKLGDIVSKPINNSIRAVTGELDDLHASIPMFRPADIDGGFADPTSAPKLTQQFEFGHQKSRVYPGDIVLGIAGSVGCVGRVPQGIAFGNINGSSARIAAAHDSGAAYLSAYLQSKFGQSSLLRYGVGSVQKHLNLEDLPGVIVYYPELVAQRYIGGKVQQAEALRKWAFSTQIAVTQLFTVYRSEIKHYAENSFKVPARDLTSARLDSSFFHPDHRALDEAMKSGGCNSLGHIAQAVKDDWNKKMGGTFLYYEIGGLDIGSGTVKPVEVDTSEAPSRAATAVRQGDILVSTVRPNRRNVGFVVEQSDERPLVATSGFSALRFRSLEDAALHHAWLRTEDATSQLLRWNSGSAYPAIDEDVPLSLLVPAFSQSEREHLGKRLLDAQFALWFSTKLMTSAKLLVEALVEGEMDVATLVAAQNGLEAGSLECDRAVLGRLKQSGLDGSDRPLLGDLDRLYELLGNVAAV